MHVRELFLDRLIAKKPALLLAVAAGRAIYWGKFDTRCPRSTGQHAHSLRVGGRFPSDFEHQNHSMPSRALAQRLCSPRGTPHTSKRATPGPLLAPKRPSIEPADYLLAGAKLMLSRRCRTAAAPPITRCSIACSLRSARARLSSPKAAAHLVNQRRADTRYIISQACRRCAGPRNKRLRRVHESSVPQDIRRSNG